MKKTMWNWRCWTFGVVWNEWAWCFQIGPLSILHPTAQLKRLDRATRGQQAAQKGLTTQTSRRRSKTKLVQQDTPRGE